MSLVPETKIVGENATRRARSRLLVVDPHSRSALPETIASMRDSEVTGNPFDLERAGRPCAPIASTSFRQSSIE